MESLDSSFVKLKNNFYIIFEHDTDVPGLADSLKHLEGFYNLCDMLGVYFLKRRFKTSRSAMVDCDNPSELIGIDRLIEDLSASAWNIITERNHERVSVNFNYLVSGTERAHVGSHKVAKLTVQEKSEILSKNLCVEILKSYGEANIDDLVIKLKSRGVEAIRFSFIVHHISIISQLIPKESRLKKYFYKFSKNQFSKGESSGELIITAHLRRGDTAVFTLPTGVLVSAWGNWRNPKNVSSDPEVLENLGEAAYIQYGFNDFLELISFSVDEATRLGLSPTVNFLSDGFWRGYQRIENHASNLNLSESDITYVKGWIEAEEARYEKELMRLSNAKNIDVNICIGENRASFVNSLSSIANSDILIAGVGGFSRTIFDKFGFKDKKLLVENVTSENMDNLNKDINMFLKSYDKRQ